MRGPLAGRDVNSMITPGGGNHDKECIWCQRQRVNSLEEVHDGVTEEMTLRLVLEDE